MLRCLKELKTKILYANLKNFCLDLFSSIEYSVHSTYQRFEISYYLLSAAKYKMELQNSRALMMKGVLDSINYECCKEKIMCRRIPDPILRTKRLTAFHVLNLAASTSS